MRFCDKHTGLPGSTARDGSCSYCEPAAAERVIRVDVTSVGDGFAGKVSMNGFELGSLELEPLEIEHSTPHGEFVIAKYCDGSVYADLWRGGNATAHLGQYQRVSDAIEACNGWRGDDAKA